MAKKTAVETYAPDVPEWFKGSHEEALAKAHQEGYKVAKRKYRESWIEKLLGEDADSYRMLLRVATWAVSLLIIIPVVAILVLAGIRGIGYSYNRFFPPDPSAPAIIQAPEALAHAIYREDRIKQGEGRGWLYANPWPEWESLDEGTRNIYRKKAIARSEGRPEGSAGQEPPETK